MSGPVRTRVSVADPEAMHELGVSLGRVLAAGDLLLLTGPLGAGKTTLTRGIGEGLGVRGPVQSPTFVLARTHPSLVGGAPLVHVDAYRLAGDGGSGAVELDDLDIDFEGSVVVAEWGAGVIDTPESWIEAAIERPVGGSAEAEPADRGAAEPREDAEAVIGPGTGADDEDWSETPVEPRIVTITAHGPRWAEGVFR
ncbi:MAG: tRNA (adenosine(37)-N6)-threonylcarbamoyltransferase complex ATPase subunit type 1 TsaE [Leucobacter sp.]